MAKITFKGNPILTQGNLPKIGSKAPDFKLTNADLNDLSLKDFDGKKKILNIVPSLDTGVCAASAQKFNTLISKNPDTVVITISKDLPFAQSRFCSAKDIKNIVTLSSMRTNTFAKDYQVEMTTGPLAGLLSRAIVVLDKDNTVLYTEQVPEIGQEPNYTNALKAAGIN
jgi:thiol peroxidase